MSAQTLYGEIKLKVSQKLRSSIPSLDWRYNHSECKVSTSAMSHIDVFRIGVVSA